MVASLVKIKKMNAVDNGVYFFGCKYLVDTVTITITYAGKPTDPLPCPPKLPVVLQFK